MHIPMLTDANGFSRLALRSQTFQDSEAYTSTWCPLRIAVHAVNEDALHSSHNRFFILIFYFNRTVFKLYTVAYDRPGLSPRHFLVFYLYSRVGPLPYNPVRHPAFIKAPRFLGSVPSYLLILVVATADPHLPSLPRSSILHVPQARHLPCWWCTLSYPCCLHPVKCSPKLGYLSGLSFLLSASFHLACEVQEALFTSC